MVMVVCQFDFKFELPKTFMKPPKMVVATLMLVLLASAHAAERKYIVNPRPADARSLPFSYVVLVGTLYIAGHTGLDRKNGQAPAGAEQEAQLEIDGIKTTVERRVCRWRISSQSDILHRFKALSNVQCSL
jgi:enamine deaminase RidA (YjgF/YER057c/UK114 family)